MIKHIFGEISHLIWNQFQIPLPLTQLLSNYSYPNLSSTPLKIQASLKDELINSFSSSTFLYLGLPLTLVPFTTFVNILLGKYSFNHSLHASKQLHSLQQTLPFSTSFSNNQFPIRAIWPSFLEPSVRTTSFLKLHSLPFHIISHPQFHLH